MQRLVYDIEANGFLEDVDTVWCIVTKDIDTLAVVEYGPDELDLALQELYHADVLIAHNQLCYDLPVLKAILGWEPNERTVIIDTLVMSRTLWPDRFPPKGWNPKWGGPHSIGAWGFRLGRGKPKHEEWDKFSPEMLHRCKEDAEINHLVYNELLKEIEA